MTSQESEPPEMDNILPGSDSVRTNIKHSNDPQQTLNNIPVQPSQGGRRYLRKQSKFAIRSTIIALTVIVMLFFPGRFIVSKGIESQLKLYTPFNNNSRIAQLAVTATNTNLKWEVRVTTYDSSGNLASQPQIFLEPCDQWRLQADIISIQPRLALGVPSGWYVLTMLIGTHCYNSHGIVDASLIQNIPIDKNTGPVTQDGAFEGLVRLITVTSTSVHPNGITYNVIIAPTSLSVTPAS